MKTCGVALMFHSPSTGELKVTCSLVTKLDGDTSDDLKNRSEEYQRERYKDGLNNFEVVAWETAEPSKSQ